MTDPIVYVVQRPARYDASKRGWVNLYSMSPALEFGELAFLIRPGNIRQEHLSEISKRIGLRVSSFRPEVDHLLPAGDPVAIALVFACIVRAHPEASELSVLKFDRRAGKYRVFKVPITGL